MAPISIPREAGEGKLTQAATLMKTEISSRTQGALGTYRVITFYSRLSTREKRKARESYTGS